MNLAVTFEAPGSVTIDEVPMPMPQSGEVLIRTLRTLISAGTELTLLRGDSRKGSVWSQLTKFPFRPGYCNVGKIIKCGTGVTADWIGSVVATHCSHSSFVTCRADELRRVPREVDIDTATLNTLAEVVMNGIRRVGVTWGESILVSGLGLLGQLAVRIGLIAGARPVVAIDLSPRRLAALPENRSVIGVLATSADTRHFILDRCNGRSADVAIEASGNASVISEVCSLLRSQGRLLLLSSPGKEVLFDFHDSCNRESLSIVGAHYFSHPPQSTANSPWSALRHSELFMKYVVTGDFDAKGIITHHFRCDRAADAYSLLSNRSDQALGVVLDWAEPETELNTEVSYDA